MIEEYKTNFRLIINYTLQFKIIVFIIINIILHDVLKVIRLTLNSLLVKNFYLLTILKARVFLLKSFFQLMYQILFHNVFKFTFSILASMVS